MIQLGTAAVIVMLMVAIYAMSNLGLQPLRGTWTPSSPREGTLLFRLETLGEEPAKRPDRVNRDLQGVIMAGVCEIT